MPIILTTIATTLFAGVLVALWVLVLRPDQTEQPMMEAQQVRELKTEVKERREVMALMVLSWSEGLRTRYEAFVDSLELDDADHVALSTKYAANVVRRATAVTGYLDSLASIGEVDKDSISLASLPSVLRNGFANAMNGTLAPYHVVVMGGFPRMPSDREMKALNRSRVILADADYVWLANSKDHKVVFISEKKNDPFRQALETAMKDTVISYQNIY